jgi:shikimate dehydrogenase
MPAGSARLEVWGDPIINSASPQLHAAAYAQLGLPWQFARRQVTVANFDVELIDARDQLLGIAVTMPLKGKAFDAVDFRDRFAELTGAVNTIVMGEQLHGYNTDVLGFIDVFRAHSIEHLAGTARILGAGATAASALVALVFLGVEQLDIRARSTGRASGLLRLARDLGVEASVRSFDEDLEPVSVTISTLPGDAVLAPITAGGLAASGGMLIDVGYHPWPTQLASVWQPSLVISGHELLLRQAVRQLRIFVSGDPELELTDEPLVIGRMREALVGD